MTNHRKDGRKEEPLSSLVCIFVRFYPYNILFYCFDPYIP